MTTYYYRRFEAEPMNKYWQDQRRAVWDGGMLRKDQIMELFWYIEKLEQVARFTLSDLSPQRYIDLNKVLEAGPKIPED